MVAASAMPGRLSSRMNFEEGILKLDHSNATICIIGSSPGPSYCTKSSNKLEYLC